MKLAERLKEQFELQQLRHKMTLLNKEQKAIMASEAYKKSDDARRLNWDSDMQVDWAELDSQMEEIQTKRVIRQARKYGVIAPSRWSEEDDRYWRDGPTGQKYFSQEGYNKVKNEIREEKKARREDRLFWIPLISGLSGLFSIILAAYLSIYTISTYQLNENLALAEIVVQFANSNNTLYFKNYGKLPGYEFNLAAAQIEFQETPLLLNEFKVSLDSSYPTEDRTYVPKILDGEKDKHAQGLILAWCYHNGKKAVVRTRVMVRTPSALNWVPTIRTSVNEKQWDEAMEIMNRLKKNVIEKTEEGIKG